MELTARDGARTLLERLAHQFSRLVLVWADGGYTGKLVNWVGGLRCQRKIRLAIVPRLGGNRFVVLPKRWIVERTLGWLMKWRRLRGDYEVRTASQRSVHLHRDDWTDDAPARSKRMNSKTRSNHRSRWGVNPIAMRPGGAYLSPEKG